jgi:hypothetical protein
MDSKSGKHRAVKSLLIATVLLGSLAAFAQPAGAAGWRAFSATSPWNVPAAQKGAVSGSNPYASQFTSYATSLELSGVAPDNQWGKPIYFAAPGDPAYTWTDLNGWAKGDIAYQGEPIPMPAGAHQATGSDGHLTIVTADRRYEYDMWRADVSTRTAATIVRFDLTGDGVPQDRTNNTSARGSGAPVIPTTLRADEALGGIDHALGLTVPNVASDYQFPATHSDGRLGPDSVEYGMLFVLRPDFSVGTGASIGERNIIAALKTYGAYVVDQGASMGLDADSTHADLWQQAGMLGDSSMPIRASDWRLVNVGTAPAGATAPAPPQGGRVVLRAARGSVRRGGRLRLFGKVVGGVPAGAKARLVARVRNRWVQLRGKQIDAASSFAANPVVRPNRGTRAMQVRALVTGVGGSNVVRVRVRR